MRSGVIALSFGFMALKSHTEGDVKVLDQLDVDEMRHALPGQPSHPRPVDEGRPPPGGGFDA